MLKKVRFILEYLPVLGLINLVRLIPASSLASIAGKLAGLWHALDKKRKNIARRNILKAMPDQFNEKNVDELVRQIFTEVAITILEIIRHVQTNDRKWIDENIEIQGGEHIENALKGGKGILFFTPHFGNWELTSLKVGLQFQKVYSVYRPLDNFYLDRLIHESRSQYNQEMFPKKGAVRSLLKALKKGECVGLLVDQHVSPYQEGIWVNFFNRKAATSPIIAELHKRTEAPVLPVFCVRQPDGKYVIEIQEELVMDEGEDQIEKNTQKINDVMEAKIREHPEHWFWIHRRWKTSPDEKS